MELIRRPGNRRVVAPPGAATTQRHGEALVTPYERSNRSRRRTGELLGAIRRLDTAIDERTKRELLDFIGGLYDESGGGVPVALFAKCWLGEPYLDHIITFSGDILRHFKHNEPVPPEFAMARPLARNDAYAFIEVYSDGTVIPVRPDGDPVT